MTQEQENGDDNNELEPIWDDSPIVTVEQTMDALIEKASAELVFDSFVEQGDTVVVPCAEVIAVMGMGVGNGSSREEGDDSNGSGGGGGGTVRGRPVAAIVIAPDGVRVEPIVDVTRLGLAALTTFAFVAYWLLRLLRGTDGKAAAKEPSLKDVQQAIQN